MMETCIGCHALVPTETGPTHPYMLAAPACWAAYGHVLAGGVRGVPDPFDGLLVDAYAVQHPGVLDPRATQSVWTHLVALHLVLERGWPSHRLGRIRGLVADGSAGWPWLTPPRDPGTVTVMDLSQALPAAAGDVARAWVEGAWAAWAAHGEAVRTRAAALVGER